ncbi:MAG TPA: ATP-binding protein, partial [Solirubrobacteraceae bacterium]|nr:ATP-binding protein [Solirubrobacteraceae bacterium]
MSVHADRGQHRRKRRTWPLWGYAATAAVLMGVVVTGGCASGLVIAGRFTLESGALCLGLGTLGTLIAATAAAFAADNAAIALRTMRDDAVHRLRSPNEPREDRGGRGGRSHRGGVRGSAEMTGLDAAVEALALRMRLADELAARSMASAQQASAGMFELLSGAIAAEETARGQLAAELHDTVAQTLAVARNSLSDGHLERAADCLEDAEDQIRALMARTRPPALRDGNLADAVVGLRDEMAQRYALRVAIDWPDEARPMPLSTAVTVFRFFQETLLNVVKHADVDDARVALRFDADKLVAQVADDGPGFVPEEVRPDRGRHVGLGLLRERIRLAGGTLDVVS